MEMKHLQSLTPKYNPFLDDLRRLHGSQMQHRRRGSVNAADVYCVVNISTSREDVLEGHITSKDGCNATFKFFLHPEHGNLLMLLRPDIPIWTFSKEKAYDQIFTCLQAMIRKADQEIGEIDTSRWMGYYLKNRRGKPVGLTGRKRFEEAFLLGLVSRPFIETCLRLGISMAYHKGKLAKAAA